MKNRSLAFCIIFTTVMTLSANNLENIYGKNDLSLDNNYSKLYGNNFGTMLEFNEMDPYFIDKNYADSEISTLLSENETFESEIVKYTNIIENDRNQQSEIYELLNKIDLLLVDLKSTSAELYALKLTLTDKELRQKLQVSIEENRQQIYDLNSKKNELDSSLNQLENKLKVSERFVTVNNLLISRNTREITFLKECISFSNQDTTTLYSVIEKSASYQNDVDNIISVSF
ncbi:MAG: hypothetical protein JEY91_14210 [Spirochaetaceae bacterium]|nr:hypothetical protein [Spirochaetaceae bacterium]